MKISLLLVGQSIKTMEFHTYLFDGKQQDSAVVNDHTERLIVFLMKEHILKEYDVIM